MKSLKKIAAGLIVLSMMFSAVLLNPVNTFAVECETGTIYNGIKCAEPTGTPSCLFGSGCAFTNVINTILFVLGAISVLMIVYGGVRYTLSGGDSSSVTAAKNTILYAVIGLVVAMLAFAISNFVVTALVK